MPHYFSASTAAIQKDDTDFLVAEIECSRGDSPKHIHGNQLAMAYVWSTTTCSWILLALFFPGLRCI
jgi:hypothetical protein